MNLVKTVSCFKVSLLIGLAAGISSVVSAQQYPAAKTVTIVVPFAAGGPSDKIARDVAEALRKPLGQMVIVDNTGGAGGTIGTTKVARANPDGYTLLVHHIGFSTAPSLYKNPGYKPDDFEYLGLINEAPSTLITRPTIQAKDFADLRKFISSNKDLNMANAGVGSASHLCGLLLQDAIKSNMTLIPYKGTAPAMTDLIGGQVDIMCEQATNSAPQIEGKKVKAYGITSAKRSQAPALAQIPTLNEAGLKGFNFNVWHGLYAPKGTPPEVVKKINEALKTALKDPELVKRQEALGITVISDTRLNPAEHKKFVSAEVAKWAKVIKDAGIQPE